MISNRFYYCITLVATIFILSSCLGSNDSNVDYNYSADAQITSFRLSSNEDTARVFSNVQFSINQVSSAPTIFNKDSLPYLFDVEKVGLNIATNGASGLKFILNNPDSSYIWNTTDSVAIKRLKQIEVFAQDGKTKKTYSFSITAHKQDPDTIFWQNVANNYISAPTNQVTISNDKSFFTYYKTNNTVQLSTSLIENGETWTSQPLSGLPENMVMKSIQNNIDEEKETWFALSSDNEVYLSEDGIEWTAKATDYPVKSIFGVLPSFTKDSVIIVVKDGDKYKFAKTIDFSSMNVMNEIPLGFPVKDFTYTQVKDSLVYSAKYLVATGGKDIYDIINRSVWLLQEGDNKITSTSMPLKFNVTGASLFNYNDKVYLLTSDNKQNKLYTSTNYGVFWETASSKQELPTEFTSRQNQSVNIDSKNNIWIFGGAAYDQTQLVEVWKGRINKLFIK